MKMRLLFFLLLMLVQIGCTDDCVRLEGDTRRCYECELRTVDFKGLYTVHSSADPMCEDYDTWNTFNHFEVKDSTNRYIIRKMYWDGLNLWYKVCKQPYGKH